MEIFYPILLVLIGLLVSQVYLMGSSKQQTMDMGAIRIQIIYYWGKSCFGDNDFENYYLNGWKNITCENLEFNNGVRNKEIGKLIGRTNGKLVEYFKFNSIYKTYYYITKFNGNGKNKDRHFYDDGKVHSLNILYIFDNKINKNYKVLKVFINDEEDNDKKDFKKDNETYYYTKILESLLSKEDIKTPQIIKVAGNTDLKDIYNKVKDDMSDELNSYIKKINLIFLTKKNLVFLYKALIINK